MTTPQNGSSWSGWKCPSCGQFVPNGQYHVCHQQPNYTYPQYIDLTVLERIAKALEEIEKLLKEKA